MSIEILKFSKLFLIAIDFFNNKCYNIQKRRWKKWQNLMKDYEK
jgi:hypothetical protein